MKVSTTTSVRLRQDTLKLLQLLVKRLEVVFANDDMPASAKTLREGSLDQQIYMMLVEAQMHIGDSEKLAEKLAKAGGK